MAFAARISNGDRAVVVTLSGIKQVAQSAFVALYRMELNSRVVFGKTRHISQSRLDFLGESFQLLKPDSGD